MGVPTGGALDRNALQYANNLVGNALATPVLEITLSGPHVRCLEPGRVALVGGGFSLLLNGAQQTDNSAVSVNAGDELVIKSSGNGCRSFLAVSGEWQVKRWLGSASALRVGSHELLPEALWQSGDVLTTRDTSVKPWPSTMLPPQPAGNLIRVLPGPEFDWLDHRGRSQLLSKPIVVVDPSNRIGLRTDTQIQLREDKCDTEMVSSGVQPGTVQLTHAGQAIILMRDGQTIGGYPRVLQCVSQSLDQLAQIKAGDELMLSLIDS
jgi:antagonist of KipI